MATLLTSKEGKKKGVNIIELREPNALSKIADFLKKEGFSIKNPPKLEDIDKLVPETTKKYDEELENTKILHKAKEIVKEGK